MSANPIEDYLNDKLAQAEKKRKVASDLSHPVHRAHCSTAVRPPKVALLAATRDTESKPNGVSAQSSPSASSTLAHSRKLTIGTGQVYNLVFDGGHHVARDSTSGRDVAASVTTRNYRIATLEIEEFYEPVAHFLRYRIMGALIYGRRVLARLGRSNTCGC